MTDAPLHVTAEAGVQTSRSQDEPESQWFGRDSNEAETDAQPPALAASTVRSSRSMNAASLDRTA